MRTLIILLLALALFAPTAFAADTSPAKLSKITGYGDYKLGTPISQYDLSEFTGQTKNDILSDDTRGCYFSC